MRRGDFTASEEHLFWADPDFFRTIVLPVVAGRLADSLDAPDSVVLTRSIARKYFGRDAPLGELLQIDGQIYRVTAILKDLPSNTHLTAEIFVSGRAPAGPPARSEGDNNALSNTVATYVRLKPGASIGSVVAGAAAFLEARMPISEAAGLGRVDRALHLVPLASSHLMPSTQGSYTQPAATEPLDAQGYRRT